MQLIDVREAAKRLNLKETTIRKYCRNGNLPAVKFPKGYRFIVSEVEDWIKRRRVSEGRKN